MMQHRAVVVGVGNEHRGDDAVGLAVARQLRRARLPDVMVLEVGERVDALLEVLPGCTTVIIVDAVRSEAPAGTIHRFDASLERVRDVPFTGSTHSFSVSQAIELAKALKLMPPRIIVYGIEGSTFDFGSSLSADVQNAVDRLVSEIVEDMKKFTQPGRPA